MSYKLDGTRFKAWTDAGAPLVGGKLYTYASGTTTPKATYTDATLGGANTNPVVLDARGEADVWLGSGAYTFVLKTAAGVTVDTVDGVVDPQEAADAAIRADLASTAPGEGASLVGTASGRTVQQRLDNEACLFDVGAFTVAEVLDIQSFGFNFDHSAKMDAALAVTAARGQLLKLPYGGYKRTTKWSIPEYGRVRGEKSNQYPTGFSTAPKATTIQFSPTGTDDAVGLTGTTHGGFRLQNSVEGIAFVAGNTNARYGFDCDHGIYGKYADLSFEGFKYGIHCSGTINNRFENVHISASTVAAVRYEGNVETTDVWEQCTLFGAPVGIDAAGSTVGIRWANCLFEQIDLTLAQLAKETQNMIFENCYGEDLCFGGSASACAFKVGTTGTTLVSQNHLIINGGHYAGRNAGAVGSFIESDYCTGIIVGGMAVSRFTNGIKTTGNTLASSIVSRGWTALSITNVINHAGSTTDYSRLTGNFPTQPIGAGVGNAQRLRARNVESENDVLYGRSLIGPNANFSAAATGVAGTLALGNGTRTTVGAAGGASALPATPLQYLDAFVGTTPVAIPCFVRGA